MNVVLALIPPTEIELVKSEANKLYTEIKENGYSEEVAMKISEEMSQKGGYAFNKSHSMAYAVTTLTTAYLKVHYPSAFFCAVLNQVSSDGGKVNKYILDAQNFGVEVVKPHINRSKAKFSIFNNKIIFGLSCINGIGESLVEEIIKERENNGKFKDLNDLLKRVKLSKKQVVSLIKSGAIPTKDKMKTIKEYAMSLIENNNENYPEYKPVKTLPSLIELKTKWNIDTDIIKDKEKRLELYNNERKKQHDTVKKQEWIEKQNKLKTDIKEEFKEKYLKDEQFWEFESLSIFLNNNPFKDIQKYITQDFYEVENGMECIIVGVVSSIQKKKDRNKKDYAYIRVYESNGLLEGLAWSSVYSKYLPLIKKGNKLAFYGEKSTDETFIVKKIKTIQEWIDDRNLNNEIIL